MERDSYEWSKLVTALNHALVDSLTNATYESASTAVAQAAATVFGYAAATYRLDSWQYAQAQAMFLYLVHDDLQSLFCVHANDILVPGGVKEDFERLDRWFSELEERVMPERARELLKAYGEFADEETIEHWKMLADRRER